MLLFQEIKGYLIFHPMILDWNICLQTHLRRSSLTLCASRQTKGSFQRGKIQKKQSITDIISCCIEGAAHPNQATQQKTESSAEYAIYNILYFHGKKMLYLSQFYLLHSPSTLYNALLKSVVCEMCFEINETDQEEREKPILRCQADRQAVRM